MNITEIKLRKLIKQCLMEESDKDLLEPDSESEDLPWTKPDDSEDESDSEFDDLLLEPDMSSEDSRAKAEISTVGGMSGGMGPNMPLGYKED